MNDSGKTPGRSGKTIGLVVLVALISAVAAHAVQMLLLGEARTAVSAGVASAIAEVTVLGVSKRK